MKILFVCTGNTCRSPMAQVMAAKLFGGDFTVISAGLAAMPSAPASANAITVMKERQIDLENHRAQLVSEDLIAGADLILTMTQSHKTSLKEAAPDKVYTVGEYANTEISITDPFGGDIEVYRTCADEIYGLLLIIQNKLGEKVE